jgi:hypothetical protein
MGERAKKGDEVSSLVHLPASTSPPLAPFPSMSALTPQEFAEAIGLKPGLDAGPARLLTDEEGEDLVRCDITASCIPDGRQLCLMSLALSSLGLSTFAQQISRTVPSG